MKQNDRIRLRIAWHMARAEELVKAGMDREAASRQAFEEVQTLRSSQLAAWNDLHKE